MGVKISKSGDNPYGDMRFHEVHGRNVQLQMNNEFARRANGLEEGICFGSRPIRKNERVSLTVVDLKEGQPGTLTIGFTKVNPAQALNKLKLDYLPPSAVPHLTKNNGYWAMQLPSEVVKRGARIEFWLSVEGAVCFGVDGTYKGILFSKVKTKKPVWPLLDLFGQTVELQLVPASLRVAPPTFQPTRTEAPAGTAVTARAEADLLAELDRERLREEPVDPFSEFERIGLHVADVHQLEFRQFSDLIWALIYAREITDELEKAKAIFLWLTTKDLTKLSFINKERDTPEGVLQGLAQGNRTFAQAFQILAAYAGLRCLVVTGYAKGYSYRPGSQFPANEWKHSWNLVHINGVWRQVDCLWAAKRLIGKQLSVETIRKDLDLFYFAPSPMHLIYSHLPDPEHPEWQLLPKPLSVAQFVALVPLKSAFFHRYNLELVTFTTAEVSVGSEAEVRFAFPRCRRGRIAFTFALVADSDDRQKFGNYGISEVTDSEVIFHLRFPEPRAYKFQAFAKTVDQTRLLAPAEKLQTDAVYEVVAEYRLNASGFKAEAAPQPYPPLSSSGYGPSEMATRYELTPELQSNIVTTTDGTAEIRFGLKKPIRLMAKLKTTRAGDDQAMERFVITRVIEGKAGHIAVFLPAAGEFGLELFANDPAVDGNTLLHTWSYLLIADAPSPLASRLPPLTRGFLGAQPKFAGLGMTPLNFPDPFVRVESSTRMLSIAFGLENPIKSTLQLFQCASADESRDVSTHALQQYVGRENKVEYLLRFPTYAFYKFHVFAAAAGDQNEGIPGVFNYLIEVRRPEGVDQPATEVFAPFPKQFAPWREGCYLYEPLDGRLLRPDPGTKVPFALEVPRAIKVAVIVGEEWTQLQQLSSEEATADPVRATMWFGDVPLDKAFDKHIERLSVVANYDTEKPSYRTLLEYSLTI